MVVGAFVMGEATVAAGLIEGMACWFRRRTRRVDQLFWLVRVVLLPVTFLVPSTSGRAAIALPLRRGLSDRLAPGSGTRPRHADTLRRSGHQNCGRHRRGIPSRRQ